MGELRVESLTAANPHYRFYDESSARRVAVEHNSEDEFVGSGNTQAFLTGYTSFQPKSVKKSINTLEGGLSFRVSLVKYVRKLRYAIHSLKTFGTFEPIEGSPT